MSTKKQTQIINIWDIDGCLVEVVPMINTEAQNAIAIQAAAIRTQFVDKIFLIEFSVHDWVFTGRKAQYHKATTYELYLTIFRRKYHEVQAKRYAKLLLAHTIFFPDDANYADYHPWKYRLFEEKCKGKGKGIGRTILQTYDDDLKILNLVAPLLLPQHLHYVHQSFCMNVSNFLRIEG
jgi:hypothetical protein